MAILFGIDLSKSLVKGLNRLNSNEKLPLPPLDHFSVLHMPRKHLEGGQKVRGMLGGPCICLPLQG